MVMQRFAPTIVLAAAVSAGVALLLLRNTTQPDSHAGDSHAAGDDALAELERRVRSLEVRKSPIPTLMHGESPPTPSEDATPVDSSLEDRLARLEAQVERLERAAAGEGDTSEVPHRSPHAAAISAYRKMSTRHLMHMTKDVSDTADAASKLAALEILLERDDLSEDQRHKVLTTLGTAHRYLKDHVQAEAIWRKIMARSGEHRQRRSQAQVQLAWERSFQGEYGDARAELQEAATGFPFRSNARLRTDWYAAMMADKSGDAETALSELEGIQSRLRDGAESLSASDRKQRGHMARRIAAEIAKLRKR